MEPTSTRPFYLLGMGPRLIAKPYSWHDAEMLLKLRDQPPTVVVS